MKLMVDMSTNVSGEVELNETTSEKTYVIKGIFSSPGVKNRNGRIYPMDIWENNVIRYQDEIKNNSINTLAELEHPSRSTVDPWLAVAKTRLLEMRESKVYGEMEILNNNSKETNQIKALIDAGIKIGVSTRGVGRLGKGQLVEEYQLITTDVVASPSDYGANLQGFSESLIMEDTNYKIEEGQVICTPEGCELVESDEDKEIIDEKKVFVVVDKDDDEKELGVFPNEKKAKEYIKDELKGKGKILPDFDDMPESECSKRAKELIEKLNEYSKEEITPNLTKLEIQAYDMYAIFEGKPTYKEIQKKIKETEAELKHQKKGSDEYEALSFELAELKKSITKLKVDESKKFDKLKFDKILKKNGSVEFSDGQGNVAYATEINGNHIFAMDIEDNEVEIDVTKSDWTMAESKIDAAQKLFIKKLNKATKKTEDAATDLTEVALQIDRQVARSIRSNFMIIWEQIDLLEDIVFSKDLHEVMKRKPTPKAGNPIDGAVKNFWRAANELKGQIKQSDSHPKIYKQLTSALDDVADVIDTINDLN